MPILALVLCWGAAAIGYVKGDPAIWIPYAFINPAIFFLSRGVYEAFPNVRRRVTKEWVGNLERLGVGLFLINIPGSLYLHGLGIQYDRFLHFTAAAFGFLIAFLVLSPLFTRLPDKKDMPKALTISGLVTFVGLFVWEGIQFSSDRLFGTLLFHDAVQPIALDVTEDILFGFAGMLIALLLLRHSRKLRARFAEKSFK